MRTDTRLRITNDRDETGERIENNTKHASWLPKQINEHKMLDDMPPLPPPWVFHKMLDIKRLQDKDRQGTSANPP